MELIRLVKNQDELLLSFSPELIFVFSILGAISFMLAIIIRKMQKIPGKEPSNSLSLLLSPAFMLAALVSLMATINAYVHKIIVNPDEVRFYTVNEFNTRLEWENIKKIEVHPEQIDFRTTRGKSYSIYLHGMNEKDKHELERIVLQYYEDE